MATWITHFIIADKVLERLPYFDRQSFLVGNIAPDCNVENEDFTSFVPSRELTHWMSSDRKTETDSDRFYHEYIENREDQIRDHKEKSFLLGYYAHLIVDAEFSKYMRDTDRIASVWKRIQEHPVLSQKAENLPQCWDSIKALISKKERTRDIHTIEAEYLETHPNSGYLTEFFRLTSFPDYIDYLPKGAIVRKIGVMKYLPQKDFEEISFIAITREEYLFWLDSVTEKIVEKMRNKV